MRFASGVFSCGKWRYTLEWPRAWSNRTRAQQCFNLSHSDSFWRSLEFHIGIILKDSCIFGKSHEKAPVYFGIHLYSRSSSTTCFHELDLPTTHTWGEATDSSSLHLLSIIYSLFLSYTILQKFVISQVFRRKCGRLATVAMAKQSKILQCRRYNDCFRKATTLIRMSRMNIDAKQTWELQYVMYYTTLSV